MGEYDSLDESMFQQARTVAQPKPAEPVQPEDVPQEDSSFWDHGVGDVLAAPVRGVESAVRNTYDLVDKATGDFLPDYNQNFTGESNTVVGGLVEGTAQFLTGFIPVAGWLGDIGALSKVGTIGRGLIAGAVTDFTVFDAHQQRLSNLIQDFPALQNPVTEFLAADPNDGMVEGRLKGALEGLGLGGLTEAAILGFKSLRVYGQELASGKTKVEAAAAAEKVVPADKMELALHGDRSDTGVILADAMEPESDLLATARVAERPDYSGVQSPDRPAFNPVSGKDKIIQRLRRDQGFADLSAKPFNAGGPPLNSSVKRIRSRPADDEIRAIEGFINRIGDRMFDDVTLKITANSAAGGKALSGPLGSFDYAKSLVTIGGNAIRQGELTNTMIHELWHSLERYLPADSVAAVTQAFEKEKAAYIAAGGNFDSTLGALDKRVSVNRYKNVSEWFAENMTSVSLDRLKRLDAASGPGVAGLFAHAKLVFRDIIDGIKAKFGYGLTQKLVRDFMENKVEAKIQMPGGLIGDGAKALSPGAPSQWESTLRGLGLGSEHVEAVREALEGRMSDTGAFPQGLASSANPRALSATERVGELLQRGDLNLSRYTGTEGSRSLIRAYEDVFDEAWRRDTTNLQPQAFHEQAAKTLAETADVLGTDPKAFAQSIMGSMDKDARELPRINARIRGYKSLVLSYSEELFKKLPKPGVELTDANRLEFARDVSQLADMTRQMKGLLGEQGRGLGANRMETDTLRGLMKLAGDDEALGRAVDQLGGRRSLDDVMEQFRAAYGNGGLEGTAAAVKLAAATRDSKFVNFLTEYWMNAVLSGPRTAVVNTLSGMAMAFYTPIENMLGAQIARGKAALAGDAAKAAAYRDVAADAMHHLTYLTSSMPEAFRWAKQSWKQNSNILDPARTVADVGNRRAVSSSALGMKPDTGIAKALDWFGKNIVNTPTRFLQSADEFTKQMVYRSSARSDLMRDAIKQGIAPADLAAHVTEGLDKMMANGQAYSSAAVYNRGLEIAKAELAKNGVNDTSQIVAFAKAYAEKNFDKGLSRIGKDALKRAEEVTFTTDLKPGFTRNLQMFVARHPTMRLIVPFVRTPINILKWTYERFEPKGAAQAMIATKFPSYAEKLTGSKSRLVQELLSGDERLVADATGRLAAGISIGMTGYTLASAGTITGRGPSDPEQRRILLNAGWQPYSIKVGDSYVSYARMDPFATLLGSISDLFDYARYVDVDKQEDVETAFNAIGVALTNNFTNKSYVTGIQNLVDMLQAPDRKFPVWARKEAASFVPNLLGQATDVTDDHMREVRSIVDALMAKVPGLSNELPPMRDVLGEPIRRTQQLGADAVGSWLNLIVPVAYSTTKDKLIASELGKLQHGFTPPKQTVNGLDLTGFKSASGQDAYDRWGELHGTVKVNGHTLSSTLKRIFKSSEYTRLSDVSTAGLDSPRIAKISSTIESFRRAAYAQVLREYPALAREERTVVKQRTLLKQGRDTRFETFGR